MVPASNTEIGGLSSFPQSPSPVDPGTIRKKLRFKDVAVGCIVWLPKRVAGSEEFYCELTGAILQKGGYWHPVVVLNINKSPESQDNNNPRVSVAIITSFRDLPLSQYHQEQVNSLNIGEAIPILPKNCYLGQNNSLTLEGGKELSKQSYVKLSNIYNIPISTLRAYGGSARRAYHLRLDKHSYLLLMQRLKQVPEEYPQTDQIWESFATRQQRRSLTEVHEMMRTVVSDPRSGIHMLRGYETASGKRTLPWSVSEDSDSAVISMDSPDHEEATRQPQSQRHVSTLSGYQTSVAPQMHLNLSTGLNYVKDLNSPLPNQPRLSGHRDYGTVQRRVERGLPDPVTYTPRASTQSRTSSCASIFYALLLVTGVIACCQFVHYLGTER